MLLKIPLSKLDLIAAQKGLFKLTFSHRENGKALTPDQVGP